MSYTTVRSTIFTTTVTESLMPLPLTYSYLHQNLMSYTKVKLKYKRYFSNKFVYEF